MLGFRKRSAVERSLPKEVRQVIDGYVHQAKAMDKSTGKKSNVDWAAMAQATIHFIRVESAENRDALNALIDANFEKNPPHITKKLLGKFIDEVGLQEKYTAMRRKASH